MALKILSPVYNKTGIAIYIQAFTKKLDKSESALKFEHLENTSEKRYDGFSLL